MTSRFLPAQWQLSLADLNSRIAAATHLFLEPPDDEMLRMIIVKLFADRQLSPDPDVVSYLIGRMERSLNAAVILVAEIDRESLARSRKITRSVAASALQKLGMS